MGLDRGLWPRGLAKKWWGKNVRGNEKFPPSKGRWKRREINALFGNFLFEERGYLRIKESAPSSIMDVGDLIPCDAEFSWS